MRWLVLLALAGCVTTETLYVPVPNEACGFMTEDVWCCARRVPNSTLVMLQCFTTREDVTDA